MSVAVDAANRIFFIVLPLLAGLSGAMLRTSIIVVAIASFATTDKCGIFNRVVERWSLERIKFGASDGGLLTRPPGLQ